METVATNILNFTPFIVQPYNANNGPAWGMAAWTKIVNANPTAVTGSVYWQTPNQAAAIIDLIKLASSTTPTLSAASSQTVFASSLNVTLPSSTTNSVVIVFVSTGGVNSTGSVTITDTAGLSWTKRLEQDRGTVSGVWMFWAPSSGALTNDVITATFSAKTSAFMEAVSISNASTYTSPFDLANASSQATSNNVEVYSTPSVSTVSTNTFAVIFIGGGGSSISQSVNGIGLQTIKNYWLDKQTFLQVMAREGVQLHVTAQSSSPYTALATDDIIAITTGAGAFTLNLPAATASGQMYRIFKVDSGAGAVTVTPNGADTINGAASLSLSSQYNQTTLVDSASGNWTNFAASGAGGSVSSVSNSDGTLTVTPTTGAVVASIALGHANTWTAAQTIPVINNTAAQTTLSGTTAGTLVWSQPEQGGSYRKFVGYLSGYKNTTTTAQTVTYPTAFTNTPMITTNAGQGGGTAYSTSTTTLTLPKSMAQTVSGVIIVEGF